ncbi:hypothetical protein Peur_011002 [Populus x canadensis]
MSDIAEITIASSPRISFSFLQSQNPPLPPRQTPENTKFDSNRPTGVENSLSYQRTTTRRWLSSGDSERNRERR